MGDLKTFFSEPAMDAPGLEGDTITARGGDPLIDLAGSSGVQPVWSDPFVSNPDGRETSNLSGLPGLPNRSLPATEGQMPPDLTDRNPGTIDQK